MGVGVAAENKVKFTLFSGGNAPSRSVALLHGVGEMTIRMRAMRRHHALVYPDSAVG